MAVSTTSAPASMAFISETKVTPVVAWQCTLICMLGISALDGRHDVVSRLRLEQGSHVLDGQRVDAEISQLAGLAHVAVDRVQGAGRVADGALRVLAHLLDSGDGPLDVAGVVEGVKHPEDIHPVVGGLLDEMVNNVVAIVAVAQQVLATQKHLQTAVREERAERSQAFPGVLVEEPDAGVEGGAAPTLDTPVPGVVNVMTGADHVFHRHSGCHQALVRVPEGKLCDTDLSLRIHVVEYANWQRRWSKRPSLSAQVHGPCLR